MPKVSTGINLNEIPNNEMPVGIFQCVVTDAKTGISGTRRPKIDFTYKIQEPAISVDPLTGAEVKTAGRLLFEAMSTKADEGNEWQLRRLLSRLKAMQVDTDTDEFDPEECLGKIVNVTVEKRKRKDTDELRSEIVRVVTAE